MNWGKSISASRGAPPRAGTAVSDSQDHRVSTSHSQSADDEVHEHEAIVVGAGVCGLYALYRLLERGIDVTVIETGADLGGTWYWNRYPGARFDSESVSYGYSFSEELLQEWDWTERFSPQPETLRYLNHVADKFSLRPHIQFGVTISGGHWDEKARQWELTTTDGRRLRCQFLILGVGLLSAPTLPRYAGIDTFQGDSFHTYDWPTEPVALSNRRVGVIGTGATGVQVIGAIAAEVAELRVFQRRPNWCAPLNNSPITAEEMADIKTRYDEIFAQCAVSPGAFVHRPDRRGFYEVPREERLAMWNRLYAEPGFGIWLGNFREIFMDPVANAEFSEFIADKIRQRVHDPITAEKLIPTDHGFGAQRVPLETRYYEAYNLDHVHLIDLQETPIDRITANGVLTHAPAGNPTEPGTEHALDVIIYATGFDAVTGAYERMALRGSDGRTIAEHWDGGPRTSFGLMCHGFPNMFMPTGPQSASASTNFPRAIEMSVDWCVGVMDHMAETGATRVEPTRAHQEEWTQHVEDLYGMMLMRTGQGWFTGYNSNVEGHEQGTIRYLVYNGGAPKFRTKITESADGGYPGFLLT